MQYKVCDAHCDTLSHLVSGGTLENATVTPERLAAGGVSLQVFALFATYGRGIEPYEKARRMLSAAGEFPVPVLTGALPAALPDAPTGVFSIEGGEILQGSLERFAEFDAAARVRMIALTWNFENEIGHPAKNGPEGGLKPFGLSLVREMNRKGVLCDVSHLNEAGFWDVIEHSTLPPVASHSNARALCEHTRNLTEAQIRAVIEKKGYIGVNFYSAFLANGRAATLEDVYRHVDAILQLGGEDVVGFGSDFDGIDAWPEGLANPADFPALLNFLAARGGYAPEVLEKIAGGNLFRVLKAAEAARQA
ncbi:MAG TPA: dipeptidase [Candidatus Ornithocaccomicrobium faecavium]|uniref:Dipeptidase n=1 Tax=Candidatus Ornithocaccomicrobium faecavium TaxID=2840890 RepID=A0A9D1P693_9FIRM|nr:dipeptidase [Candidatus Ornithocaccomicrobium faecavium]